MTDLPCDIRQLGPAELEYCLDGLNRVLIDCVADGAAISFMDPLTPDTAQRFWRTVVKPEVEQNDRLLFGAFLDNQLVGTVQLIIGMPPNQPHRAEISKMMVHPDGRRRGIGTSLMTAAMDAAIQAGKALITLDTRTGDVSEALYRSVGFEVAGVIPDYAFDPDGKARHATTYMYRYL